MVNYVGGMSDRGESGDGVPRGRTPRLLVLTPDFPPARGGIQTLVHRVASALDAFEVRVLTLGHPGAERFDAESGLSTRRVSKDGARATKRNVELNAAAMREAVAFRPELTLSAHIVTSPAAAAIRRVQGASTVQYFYAKEIPRRPRLSAFAARHADAVISISSYTSALLVTLGVPPERISLIPPGVDWPAARSEGPDGGSVQPADRPTFVTIARLADRYKGHDVLVRALEVVRGRVPDVQWIVIGDGPLRAELEALARASGVADCARFLGEVSDEERDSWLRRADLLAMPSRLPGTGAAGEGFGIVYLEAAAFGKPVVAGNVGGAIDAVLDGVTGLLVEPTDPVAVAEAITRLLLDRQLARTLGMAGAERAYSLAWPVIARRVQDLLLAQLKQGRGPRAPRRAGRRTALERVAAGVRRAPL